jgi:hypothetical protein
MCSSSMRAHTGAFGFKRAAPFSYVDKTGWCYLLQNAGACKIADFGVELFTRQIESERQCSATAPGLDSASTSIERNILHKHTTPSSYSYTDPNQIRSAWDYRRRATMPACSRTRTLRRWLHR